MIDEEALHYAHGHITSVNQSHALSNRSKWLAQSTALNFHHQQSQPSCRQLVKAMHIMQHIVRIIFFINHTQRTERSTIPTSNDDSLRQVSYSYLWQLCYSFFFSKVCTSSFKWMLTRSSNKIFCQFRTCRLVEKLNIVDFLLLIENGRLPYRSDRLSIILTVIPRRPA